MIVMRHVKHHACHIQEDIWAFLSVLSLVRLCSRSVPLSGAATRVDLPLEREDEKRLGVFLDGMQGVNGSCAADASARLVNHAAPAAQLVIAQLEQLLQTKIVGFVAKLEKCLKPCT